MPRIRTIKPEFWGDYRLANQLTRDERLFYIGLWNEADDEGRFLAHPRRLLGAIFPYEPDIDEGWVVKSLDRLARTGRLTLYVVDGEPYGQLCKFCDHQRINRPSPSKIPAPGANLDASVKAHGGLTEYSRQERKGREGRGSALTDSLSEWLGEFSPMLDGCIHTATQQARDSLYQRYGPPEMDRQAWRDDSGRPLDKELRPRVFAIAISGYGLEGGRFIDRQFAKKLKGHIRDELTRPRDGPDPPSGKTMTRQQLHDLYKPKPDNEHQA